MPEAIQSLGSNVCVYDPSQDASSAAPASKAEPSPPPASPPGAMVLVNKHPPAAPQCLAEKTALAAASGNLVRAAANVIVGAPTIVGDIPAILTFIGSAITVGATAAALVNCEAAAAQTETK